MLNNSNPNLLFPSQIPVQRSPIQFFLDDKKANSSSQFTPCFDPLLLSLHLIFRFLNAILRVSVESFRLVDRCAPPDSRLTRDISVELRYKDSNLHIWDLLWSSIAPPFLEITEKKTTFQSHTTCPAEENDLIRRLLLTPRNDIRNFAWTMQKRQSYIHNRETCCMICDLRIGIIVLAILGMVRNSNFISYLLAYLSWLY